MPFATKMCSKTTDDNRDNNYENSDKYVLSLLQEIPHQVVLMLTLR